MKPKGRATSLAMLTVMVFSILILARVKEQSYVQKDADRYMSALAPMLASWENIIPKEKGRLHPIAIDDICKRVDRDKTRIHELFMRGEPYIVRNNILGFGSISGWTLIDIRVHELSNERFGIMLIFEERAADDDWISPWDSLKYIMRDSELHAGYFDESFSRSEFIFNDIPMTYQNISDGLINMAKHSGIVATTGLEAYSILKTNWDSQTVRLPVINQDVRASTAAIALPILIFALCALFTSEVKYRKRDFKNPSVLVALMEAESLHERFVLAVWQILIFLSPLVVCYSSVSILLLHKSTTLMWLLAVILCGLTELSLIVLVRRNWWLLRAWLRSHK